MKKIAQDDKPGHLGTDMSRDYVYTEWDGVSRFAKNFVTGHDTQAETTSGYRDHRGTERQPAAWTTPVRVGVCRNVMCRWSTGPRCTSRAQRVLS